RRRWPAAATPTSSSARAAARARTGRCSPCPGWPVPLNSGRPRRERRPLQESDRGNTRMSTAPESPKTSRLGGVSTGFWLVLLVLSVVVFATNTGVATYQGSRLAGASTGAADLQVLSQQLANQGRDAVGGNAEAFTAFRQTRARIVSTVSGLQQPFGGEPGVAAPLQQLGRTWNPLAQQSAQILESEEAVLALAGNADRFVGRVPQLQAQLNEVVRAMTAGGAPAAQVFNALQQVVVAGTMARRVTEIRAGGPGASAAGDALARDAVVFTQVLTGLMEGNE